LVGALCICFIVVFSMLPPLLFYPFSLMIYFLLLFFLWMRRLIPQATYIRILCSSPIHRISFVLAVRVLGVVSTLPTFIELTSSYQQSKKSKEKSITRLTKASLQTTQHLPPPEAINKNNTYQAIKLSNTAQFF